MKCIIVDDDELSRLAIEKCVKSNIELNLAKVCSSAKEALQVIDKEPIDLIFLDVEMPEMSGMDFIRNYQKDSQVVIVSGKRDYAAESYDYNVTDYILKPVDIARFNKAVEKAKQIAENFKVAYKKESELYIKKDSSYVKLNLNDIQYVEAMADYVNIYTNTGRHTILSTMKSIETKLPTSDFVRIHRSYIVRLDKVEKYEESSVKVGDKMLPVSRSQKENIIARLKIL